ncbi:cyclic nucleotide-binding protein [Streptococcus canis]|nr:cyclic nucleotide-binding protein [Streptococcus canis]
MALYRLRYLNDMIDNAKLKNESIRDMMSEMSKKQKKRIFNVQEELDSQITFGQRLADQVAHFGGTWTFIISFMIFMALWMIFNVMNPFGLAFDKYPFILLNLSLSTLAAIQAPLIMMSQNRASEYDRLQAKNDYDVNKISEEGIRLLHTKLDHLVLQDQSDLMHIQKLQMDILISITKQLAQDAGEYVVADQD